VVYSGVKIRNGKLTAQYICVVKLFSKKRKIYLRLKKLSSSCLSWLTNFNFNYADALRRYARIFDVSETGQEEVTSKRLDAPNYFFNYRFCVTKQ
jgi:hypothetical protein